MRTLPDNPNLEYLRREAKDVREALRESGSDVSLADAQRLLAEQYGFRAWADLKAEVDRRRGSVEAGDPELARALAQAFGLGELTGPMTPIAHEAMGRKWTLETDRGRWIVGPLYDWVNEQQAEAGVRLQEAARAAGVVAPEPVRGPDGGLVKQIAERNWRADEWVHVGPSPAKPVRAAVLKAVGRTIATLHGLGLPAPGAMHPFLTYRRAAGDWDDLLRRAHDAGLPWASQLASILPSVLDLAATDVPPPPSEPILCHSNLIPENVRLGGGDDIVVFHWDFAGPLVAEWELASDLLHWGVFGEPDEEPNTLALSALAEGYASVAGAFPNLDQSSFCIAISGWLNWLYSQACSAIDAPDPDTKRFAETETRGLLANPLTATTLDRVVSALATGLERPSRS